MAGAFTAVDLARLPLPDAVEVLDFEVILAEMLADYQLRDPAYSALVESDPAYKVLEVAAFRELLLRQRVNEAIKALCLAYANDADLDQIAARYNVERLLIDAGDPDTIPPIPPTYESNDSLRRRVQLSFEGFSTAGPSGAYIFHSLGADADVMDVGVDSPSPGVVEVAVLSRIGDGAASPELVAAVEATLSNEDVRPLTDNVIVFAAGIVNYAIDATLYFYSGPDSEVVMQSAQTGIDRYVAENHRLGRDITVSGVMAALHQPGVQQVILNGFVHVSVDWWQASYCTAITLTYGGTGE